MTREAMLARNFVQLADTLVDDFDVVDVLTKLTDACVETLDVTAAGVMLAAPDGQLRVMASSSDPMRMLELLEVQEQEGPCLDAHRSGAGVASADLAEEERRWPIFAPEAISLGFRSAHALPLRLHGAVLGALNLFRSGVGLLGRAEVEVAQAFADVATIAILQHRAALQTQVVNEQLVLALNSRIVVEQAKGMVAERRNLDMDRSFATLRHHARNHNLRLTDLAEAVIAGTVPVSSLDPPPTAGR